MVAKRLKVLISSFAFSPYEGSEGGVGWNIVSRLANYHDITVLIGDVTSPFKRKIDLDKWFIDHAPIPGLKIVHVPPDRGMMFWEKMHHLPFLWALYYRSYRLWQKKAYNVARELHSSTRFDACHQLTYLSCREPGYLWKLNIPFFWGPISGADNVPRSFYPMLQSEEHGKIWLRDFLNTIQLRLSFLSAKAARRATRVWCIGQTDLSLVRDQWGASAEQLFESGTDLIPELAISKRVDEPLKLFWCGKHIARKALPILLQALKRLPLSYSWKLDILGDGPSTEHWKKMALSMNIPVDRITWAGSLQKSEAMKRMKEAHLLVHTGLKEGTPVIVMDALSLGLPVICHDACGMAAAVNDQCGFKVPLLDPETSICGFHDAILEFLESPHLLERLSQGAIARAKELTWDRIAQCIAGAYSA